MHLVVEVHAVRVETVFLEDTFDAKRGTADLDLFSYRVFILEQRLGCLEADERDARGRTNFGAAEELSTHDASPHHDVGALASAADHQASVHVSVAHLAGCRLPGVEVDDLRQLGG